MRITRKQYEFVIKKLEEEEKNPDPERLKRIKQAQENARKMKVIYH